MSQQVHYSLIQYRGDPVRQEALNVGVAVMTTQGKVRVLVDRGAVRRIGPMAPGFNRRLLSAFVRDLRHLLLDTHQLLLGEAVQITASAESLRALAAFTSNQFGLTDPRPYNAATLEEASLNLYRRMVVDSPRAPRKSRHMGQASLRVMIGDILEAWTHARGEGLSIEPKVEMRGAITTHVADLVAFQGDVPRMIFFAAPLVGPTATLIRDALPTVVRDLRRENRDASFFAVLGDTGVDPRYPDNPAAIARTVLATVDGLTVLGVEDLKKEFGTQARGI